MNTITQDFPKPISPSPRNRKSKQLSARISFLRGVKLRQAPLPATLFLMAMLFPPQFYLYLGSLKMTVLSAFMLIMVVPAVSKLVARREIRQFDILFMCFALWTMAALCVNHGFAYGMEAGGMRLVATFFPFLIARTYIRTPEQMLAVLKLILTIVAIMLIPAMIESMTHNPFIQNFATAITGNGGGHVKSERLGMMRATVVFAHPILFGLFCVSIFSVVTFSERRLVHKFIWGTIIFAAAFFSLSSGPLLGLITTFLLLLWEYSTRKYQARLILSLCAVTILYVVALTFKASPLFYFISRVTFNPATTYYRQLIWEHGSDNVINNPWFGIGFHDWIRPFWMTSDSLDNFWLRIAMVGGVPSLIFLALGIVLLLRSVDKHKTRSSKDLYFLRMGWIFSVLSLVMGGATVDMFGTSLPYFFFFLGMGVCLTRRYGSEVKRRAIT